MALISTLEHCLLQPARCLLLPAAAAALFGYAPMTFGSDISPAEREVGKIRQELEPIYYKTDDYARILTPEKRQAIVASYDKFVRANDYFSAREVADLLVRSLTAAKLTESDKNGFLPYASSLFVKLGTRPFNTTEKCEPAFETKLFQKLNAAVVSYTQAARCQDRATVMGNLLEGLAHKAATYDNNPSLAYILLTYGGYRGAKQSNEARALLATTQRACTKDYETAALLVRSLPQFRSASLGGQHAAVIKTADVMLATFDEKKYPVWPFNDLRQEARLRKAYALHLQKDTKGSLAVAEACQLENPGWDLEPLGQGNEPKTAAYRTAERAFLTNPLRLSALAGMIDASEGESRDHLTALLNAIQPDGELAQKYKAGKPVAGTVITGGLDKKDPPAVNKPQQPEEKE